MLIHVSLPEDTVALLDSIAEESPIYRTRSAVLNYLVYMGYSEYAAASQETGHTGLPKYLPKDLPKKEKKK